MTDKKVYSDKYTVESEIARGGMGVVYKAVHTALGRGVALKVLHSQYSGDPAFVQRFLREARAMARLDHANIIRVFDVAEDAGAHYIVMEYFPATDLKRVILERNELPVDQAVAVAEQIAEGLAYAHEQGIVHRDIKPGNVMINDAGQVKIADFGIAAAADEISVTATGQVLGTPEYMSPEQARGDELDGRSDLYSLGMVLYELLTGRTPFKSISKMAIVGKLLYEDAALPLEFPDNVPEPVRELVRTLLNRDPAARVADAPAVVSRLREIQAGLEMGAAQAPPAPPEDLGEATLVMDRPPTEADLARPKSVREASLPPERRRADTGVGAAAGVSGTAGTDRAPTPADLGYAPGPPPKRLELGGRAKVLAGAGAAGVLALGLIGYLVFSGGETEAPPVAAPATTTAPAPPAGVTRAEATELLDRAAALQTQADEARANAEALGADHRAPEVYGGARDRQADGVDRIATAQAAIDAGRFDEAKGALEEGSGFLTSAIDGFTSARTQAASVAEEERAAQERARAEADRAEAERRRLAAEAERRRVEEAALRRQQAPPRTQAPPQGGSTTSGRADIEVVGEMLAIFKTAYQNRDVGTLAEVSRISDEKRRFLNEIFGNYKTVEVSVSGFNLMQDRATAVVTIERLVGTDGNTVIPSAAWRTAKLSMRKRGGEWQRIEW